MITAVQPTDEPAATFNRDYLSWSAISTYQQCPLRFYFRYVQGLAEPFISASLAFGGAVHSAVEFHFNELLSGNGPPDQDTLLAAFLQEWTSRSETAEIQFGRSENLNSIAKTADRVLTAFRESDLAQPVGRIIGIEEELRGELIAGLPPILGRVDLIVETPDKLTITDLKTARSRWSTEQAHRSGEQLLLYAELARDLVPGKPIQLQFAVISKTAKPSIDCLPVAFSPQRSDRTKFVVQRVWHAIRHGHFYPSPSAMTCPGCAYRTECDAWPA